MKNIKAFLLFCFLIILPFTGATSAASLTWMGNTLGGDGFSWSDPLNWSTNSADPGPVPGPADHASIKGNIGGTWPVVQAGVSANPF